MKKVLILLGAGLLAWLCTGLYFVQPDEQAVVRRFGGVLATPREPGAHFGLPWGLDRVDRLKTREVKRVTIGPVRLAGEAVGASVAQFLSGDRNLINVRATIQYTVKDPIRYLFQTAAVDPLVAKAGEAALTQVLASEPVDHALTLGKQELGVHVRSHLQTLLDRYQLGVTIRSVDIGAVEPPPEVAEAFDNVIRALRERDRQINEAQSYANRTLEESRAGGQRIRDEARAARDRAVRQAEGDAERFEKLLAEYLQSPELTARRLYLETMAETLPRFRSKVIIDSESGLDLSIVGEEKP